MVITPGINDLEYTYKNGVKFFNLVAEEINWEILDGISINAWGYNGSTPGPTIRVFPGDKVCIRVINNLPEKTSVNWHGLIIPNNMDGVPPVEPSPYIYPGDYYDYQFTITNPPGTYMYKANVNVSKQINAGLMGGFIVENPRTVNALNYKDYLILLQEWDLSQTQNVTTANGTYNLNLKNPDFNYFTMNGKSYPNTEPLLVSCCDKVKIRFGNLQKNNQPINLNGHQFLVSGSDGFPVNPPTNICKNCINVASGETWDVEFLADNFGIWPLSSSKPENLTNNGNSELGGMFTTVTYI